MSAWALRAAPLSCTASASRRAYSSTVVSLAFKEARTARPLSLRVANTVASCRRITADIAVVAVGVAHLTSAIVVVVVVVEVAVVQLTNQKIEGDVVRVGVVAVAQLNQKRFGVDVVVEVATDVQFNQKELKLVWLL
uniref:Uncharacterized protein n=1 Tax=Meloidogyne incognita TaxID=6306 RepID=A0A914L3R8_MELIC